MNRVLVGTIQSFLLETSNRVYLVKDDLENSGTLLMKALLKSSFEFFEEKTLFCFENREEKVKKELGIDLNEKWNVVDGWSDPLGWRRWNDSGSNRAHSAHQAACHSLESGRSASSCQSEQSPDNSAIQLKQTILYDDALSHVQNAINTEKSSSLVVIDSLSPLILHRGVQCAVQVMNGVASIQDQTKRRRRLVCCLHQDMHDSTSSQDGDIGAWLSRYAQVTLTCIPGNRVHLTLRKPNSIKVIQKTYHFDPKRLEKLTDLQEVKHSLSTSETSGTSSATKEPGTISTTAPSPLASFNLSLSDKEREDRSNLVLPYSAARGVIKGAAPPTGGEIFYTPDDADDFDEEDPDDDLDI